MTSPDAVRTGGCLCGAVRYSVRGEPVHIGACHCADCRKRSGSAFTIYGHWPRDRFELDGEPAGWRHDVFCPRCGSTLFYDDGDPVVIEIQLGSLDDAPFDLVPESELWVKRREPWLHAVPGASQHAEDSR